jgi:hypothetical protein
MGRRIARAIRDWRWGVCDRGHLVREADAAEALGQVGLVQTLNALQVLFERLDHAIWQHCYTILVPLGVAHDDRATLEVNILDTQPQALQEAQAGAIEKPGLELIDAGKLGDHAQNLVLGQHGGQVLRFLGAHGVDGIGEFMVEDIAIEEKECGKGLILGGSGDMPFDG